MTRPTGNATKTIQLIQLSWLTLLVVGCSVPGGDNETSMAAPNPSTVSFASQDEARLYGRAFEAVVWAMPMLQSMQMRNEIVRHSDAENTLGYLSSPPTARVVLPTFNNTTAYVFGDISLKQGPMVFEVPPASEAARFFGSLSNVWDRPLEDFGPDGIDEGQGGRFLLLPPGYEGDVPAGYTAIACDSYYVHLWLRSIPSADGDEGWNDAVEYSRTLQLHSLAEADDPPETKWLDVSSVNGYFWGNPLPENDDIFGLIDSYVQEEVVFVDDLMAHGMLRALGIEKGEIFNPVDNVRAVLDRAAEDAFHYMEDYLGNSRAFVPFWDDLSWGAFRFTPEIVSGRGSWVLNDYQDYHARATDMYYWAVGMPARFDPTGGGATFYLMTATDSNGQPLDGSRNYRLTIPADVPVRDFWSLILYSTRTRSFTDSQRFGLSSLDALDENADGTTDVYIGPEAPAGSESNWLGTVAGDGLFVCFRFYGPQEPLTTKSWTLAEFEPLD